jgi:hypothetical protein
MTTLRLNQGQPAGSLAGGYARHFEARPEPIFSRHVRLMVDASNIRKKKVGDLKVFHIPHLLTGSDEVFLGFGKPNMYIVVPDGKDHSDAKGNKPKYGYQKFAGKSLKRAPSVIEDTRLWVQAGIQVRLLGLPQESHEAIRQAMQKHHGTKYWTCVNACLRVLEDAGFTFGPGGPKLSSIYFPYALFKSLLKWGLYYNGQVVNFEFVRTADEDLNAYMGEVIQAELLTFCRHADRTIEGKAEAGSKFWKGVRAIRNAPGKLFSRKKGATTPTTTAPHVVAPPLPTDVAVRNDIRVEMSTPSMFGVFIRWFWGQHVLFRISTDRVNVHDYIDEPLLEPFPGKLSFVSRLKKWVLFNRFVIRYFLRHLAPRWEDLGTFDERTALAMLRTHSDESPNKYNVVITEEAIVIARISSQGRWKWAAKLAAWVLSKHVLLANWKNVPWAGEGWKEVSADVDLDGNSGTFKPADVRTKKAVRYLNAVCPSWRVVFHTSARG